MDAGTVANKTYEVLTFFDSLPEHKPSALQDLLDLIWCRAEQGHFYLVTEIFNEEQVEELRQLRFRVITNSVMVTQRCYMINWD